MSGRRDAVRHPTALLTQVTMRTRHAAALLAAALASRPAAAQTLQEFTVRRDAQRELVVFADGNVKNVVSQPEDATSATGTLGMTYRGHKYIVTGVVNVLDRTDTLTSGFGASLLPPATGRAFNSGLIDIRAPGLPRLGRGCAAGSTAVRCNFGFHTYASVSTTRWGLPAAEEGGAPTNVSDVPVWGTGTGIYYRFFSGSVGSDPDPAKNARAAMALDVLLTTRHVRGDISARGAMRRAFLGTEQRNFVGAEFGLNLRYNELNGGLTYYYLNGRVDGLSRGQVVAALSVRARLNAGTFTPD